MQKEKEFASLFGLSDHESNLYLAGLNFDAVSLTDLAKAADIPRTAAYYPLKALVEKGLMSSLRIGKRVHYRSIDIAHLSNILDARKRKLEELMADISPTLRIADGSLSVQYFPGIHGIGTALDIFLNTSTSKLWYTFEQPLHPFHKYGEKPFDDYITRRVALKIHAHTIVPGTMSEHPWFKKHLANDEQELRKTIIVSPETYPVEATLLTDGEHVLIFSMQGVPFGILIHNPPIAQSFVSLHKIAWDRYR